MGVEVLMGESGVVGLRLTVHISNSKWHMSADLLRGLCSLLYSTVAQLSGSSRAETDVGHKSLSSRLPSHGSYFH